MFKDDCTHIKKTIFDMRSKIFFLSLYLSSVVSFLLFVILIGSNRLNHDVAIHLQQVSQFLLHGQMPYVDFFEINPPAVFIVHIPPVLASIILETPVVQTFYFFVVLLAVVSSLSSARFMTQAIDAKNYTLVLAFLLIVINFPLLFIGDAPVDRSEFGQRDHLFALGFMPFFSLRWSRWSGNHQGVFTAIGIGFLAGFFSILKPYFLLVVAAPEVYWMALRRKPRLLFAPECLSFAVVGVMYLVHFAFLPLDIYQSFFQRWLPFLMRHYCVYDAPWQNLLTNPFLWSSLFLALLAFAPGRWFKQLRTNLQPVATFSLAAAVIFFWQHKGWFYHSLPMLFGLATAMALSLLHLSLREGKIGIWSRRVLGMAAVVLAAGMVCIGVRAPTFAIQNPIAKAIRQIIQPGDPVMFLSTSATPAFPTTTQVGALPGSRYFYSFPVLMVLDDPKEERRFLAELREDIAQRKPRVIVIQSRWYCQSCPSGMSMLNYLAGRGVLHEMIKDYRLTVEIEGQSLYRRLKGR